MALINWLREWNDLRRQDLISDSTIKLAIVAGVILSGAFLGWN